MVELTNEPIDTAALVTRVSSTAAGAVVLFVGTTREFTAERRTESLDYECFAEMAQQKLAELEAEARAKWQLVECAIVHRLGHVSVGEASVAIAVSSAHRDVAFAAGKWLIDTLKLVVPIWKKENWADGTTEWVHPGFTPQARSRASRLNNATRRLHCFVDDGMMERMTRTLSSAGPTRRPAWDDGPLVDGFGRIHSNLRISVTDRCNIRCFYCMPAENVAFKPRHEILTFEEITRFVRIVARLGVNKLRLTGGEPLVRQNLGRLVASLVQVPGIDDIALTTNGILLAEQAQALYDAGLHRLNVSLDALDAATFRRIARRDGFERILEGLFEARRVGFRRIRLNTVAIRGITDGQIVPLARFAREHDFELRFIEFMPLDADGAWDNSQVLSGDEIRRVMESEIARLEPLPVTDASQPATNYRFVDGGGTIGFINPVTQPFCGNCNRLRLTAEGQVRNCLFSTVEWDARALLRRGASDAELVEMVRASVGAKKAGHGINSEEFLKPQRAMYQIGG